MRSLYTIILIACAACLFSCGSKNSDPKTSIVAQWTLQQEHVVVYRDNAKILDTVLIAGGQTHGMAQFNSDGSYTSLAAYAGNTSSLIQTIPSSSGNNTGTYSYSASSFTVNPGLAGWYSYITGSSTQPVTDASTIQLTSLTGSALGVHTSITFSVTYNSAAHTIQQVSDLSYSK